MNNQIKEEGLTDAYLLGKYDGIKQGRADAIIAMKNDLYKKLTKEINNPYQDQSMCQGLYYGIQRCDWYLDDEKEQNNV